MCRAFFFHSICAAISPFYRRKNKLIFPIKKRFFCRCFTARWFDSRRWCWRAHTQDQQHVGKKVKKVSTQKNHRMLTDVSLLPPPKNHFALLLKIFVDCCRAIAERAGKKSTTHRCRLGSSEINKQVEVALWEHETKTIHILRDSK